MYILCLVTFALAFMLQVLAEGEISKGTKCTCDDFWTFSKLYCTLKSANDFVDIEDGICKHRIKELELRLPQNSEIFSSVLPRIQLFRLVIIGEYIENVSESAFMEYRDSLGFLEISRGVLKDIPLPALKGLPSLRTLLLQENSIRSVGFLLKEVPLTSLILRDNEISLVETSAFPRLLSFLSLTNNYIEKLNGSLRGLRELVHLFVDRNRITTLEGELEGLNKVSLLNAAWNKIESIGSDPVNLPELRWLNVSHNRISELDRSLLGFTNLQSLDLSYNDIRSLKSESFSSLPDLEFLSLSANSIRSLEDSVFQNVTGLKTLIISNNMIKSLVSKTSGLHSLKKLDASWNSIRQIDNAFSELTALEEIDLSYNRISSMSNMLSSIPRLRVLNLAWNELKYIGEGSFRGAKSLEILNLSSNGLRRLKGTVFTPSARLMSLDLTLNTIGGSKLDELLVPGFMNISLTNDVATSSCNCQRKKVLILGDGSTCPPALIPYSKVELLEANGIELIGC